MKKSSSPVVLALALASAFLCAVAAFADCPTPCPSAAATALNASAACYYVDPSSGNNSNAGTSPAAPWKSLSEINSYGLVWTTAAVTSTVSSGSTITLTLTTSTGNPSGSLPIGTSFTIAGDVGNTYVTTNSISVSVVGGLYELVGVTVNQPFQMTESSGAAVTIAPNGFTGSDAICFKRPSTFYWHMRLNGPNQVSGAPPGGVFAGGTSFGASAPFSIDAYGNGKAPIIQGEIPVTGWTCAANLCSALVSAPGEGGGFSPSNSNMVKFGGIWGTCQGMGVAGFCPSTAGTSSLAHDRDWYYEVSGGGCLSNCGSAKGTLHVYDDIGTNPTTDFGAGGISLVGDGSGQLLDLDGVSYVSVQHLQLLNYSWYGLQYRGGSSTPGDPVDHLTVANVFADTEVPFNYHGVGFYIAPESQAADVNFYNVDAHRGYTGFEFEPARNSTNGYDPVNILQAATIRNCRAYFNRDVGILDNTSLAYGNITSVQVSASNVATIAVANTFSAGDGVFFQSLGNATFLNDTTVTVLRATPTQITANIPSGHASYGPTSETSGTAQM